jgi:hypothetical protein
LEKRKGEVEIDVEIPMERGLPRHSTTTAVVVHF